MRLFTLTLFTMIAFAGNSVLNRIAVDTYNMDPLNFASLRLLSGALTLWFIIYCIEGKKTWMRVKRISFSPDRIYGALALSLYMAGFSIAYRNLDAGVGALILFGSLQIILIGWSSLQGKRPSWVEISGVSLALIGLLVLLWPTQSVQISLSSSLIMVAAAIGWGAYNILGKKCPDSLSISAVQFTLSSPPFLLFSFYFIQSTPSFEAILISVLSGAITSGLAYALWYALLPKLSIFTVSLSQLSVPVISVIAGAILLNEAVSLKTAISCAIVLIGIALPIVFSSHKKMEKSAIQKRQAQ